MYTAYIGGTELASGEVSHEVCAEAVRKYFGDVPLFPRFVPDSYSPRPYETILSIHGEFGVSRRVAVSEHEKEFVYILGGLVALIDGGLTTVEEAQRSLDALKTNMGSWTSLGKAHVRELVRRHYRSDKTTLKLVGDKLTIVPKE